MTNSRTRGSKQSRASCKVRVSQHLFHTKISVTLEPITSEQATKWAAACPSYRSGPLSSQGEADREGACKSMNHAQKYLAQANRHRRLREWSWEIQRRLKPLGIRLSGDGFKSEFAAKLAGEKALSPHSPDNVLSFGVTCAIQI